MKHTKILFALLLTLCMVMTVVSVFPMAVSSPSEEVTEAVGDAWDGGIDQDWITANPYATTTEFHISTPEQLAAFRSICTDANDFYEKVVYLDADIYLNNVTEIISDSEFTLETTNAWGGIRYFSGTFDGQGHTVYGMYCPSGNNNNPVGLFGRLDGTSGTVTFRNLNVKYCKTVGHGGAIVGQTYDRATKVFENCHVIGNLSTTAGNLGGIAGQSPWAQYSKNIFNDCSFRGAITSSGTDPIGGITSKGENTNSPDFNNCYVDAVITSAGANYAGGLAGKIDGTATVSNCGAAGKIVTGETTLGAGGLFGYLKEESTTHSKYAVTFTVVNSYAATEFEATAATTPCGRLFGAFISGGYATISVDAGNYYLSGEDYAGSHTASEYKDGYGATIAPTTFTTDGVPALLTALNAWVAENTDYTAWHVGYNGYPVHTTLPFGGEIPTQFENLADIVTVGTLSGAEIKLKNADETLLRFIAGVKDSYIAELTTKHTVGGTAPTIQVGTLIAETTLVETLSGTLTATSLIENKVQGLKTVIKDYTTGTKADTESGTHYWTALSDTILIEDIGTEYSAFSFVKIKDADNTITYYSAPYDTECNVRSALEVAVMSYTIDRDSTGESIYPAAKLDILKAYLDSSAFISTTGGAAEIITDFGAYYTNPYEVSENSDGDIVLTASHLTETSSLYLVLDGTVLTNRGEGANAAFVFETGRVTVSLLSSAE